MQRLLQGIQRMVSAEACLQAERGERMRLSPLVYYAKSDKGRQGYIMSLDMAKLMVKHKPPPDERERAQEAFKAEVPTESHPKVNAPYIGD